MSIRNRTATVISGAAVATALAGAAAFAAVDTPSAPATMGGMPAHMMGLDGPVLAETHTLMHEGASVGEEERWMSEHGLDIGQMHRDMTRAGMNPGSMHVAWPPVADGNHLRPTRTTQRGAWSQLGRTDP
jgi:hypothetical protein